MTVVSNNLICVLNNVVIISMLSHTHTHTHTYILIGTKRISLGFKRLCVCRCICIYLFKCVGASKLCKWHGALYLNKNLICWKLFVKYQHVNYYFITPIDHKLWQQHFETRKSCNKYSKTEFVPYIKHSETQLQRPVTEFCIEEKYMFIVRITLNIQIRSATKLRVVTLRVDCAQNFRKRFFKFVVIDSSTWIMNFI